MNLEERIELHRERLAADVAQIAKNQTQFSENLLRLEESQIQFVAGLFALAEGQRKLQETLERYIRFRGNGQKN